MKKQSKKPAKWSVESAAKRVAKESCDTVGLSHFGPSFQRVAEQIIRETLREAATRCEQVYMIEIRQYGPDVSLGSLRCAQAIRAMLGRGKRKTHDLKKA